MIVALALFAWQQGDDDGGGPLNAIAKAAERTQRESGGRATMRSIVTYPGRSETLTITGQMVFDTETGRTQTVMAVPDPESGDSFEIEVVTDGVVFYVRSDQFGSLLDGREWMMLDFSSFGLQRSAQLPANTDAQGELALLEVADEVQKLGKEDVHGVQTTRYRGTIDVSEQVERLEDEGAEDLATYAQEEGTPMLVEAWVNVEGLVRRARIVRSSPSPDGEGPMTTDMRMDFFDFGDVPEIDVPESSEVFDATALAQSEIDRSNGE